MVGWVASLVVIADGATSTELSSLFGELWFVNLVLFVCLTCMCFLRAVCLCVFSCVPNGCLYEWFGFGELVWGGYVLYHTIIVHSSCTLQSSLLLHSPDTVKMGMFLANSLYSTVEENLQQTSITRSGSPHNALHSLVVMRAFCVCKMNWAAAPWVALCK